MKHTDLISRRQFVQLLCALSASWSTTSIAIAHKVLGQAEADVYKDLQDPWLTLSEVQEHLFPADDNSPGARDISALRYLRNIQESPGGDTDEKHFIIQGVSWLNDLSVKNHQKVFRQLNTENRESVLRTIEGSRAGSRWLSLVMTNLIEALLSDPVYGGNQQARGWKWLEHKPGFPTPTIDKLYFELGKASRRETKA